MWPFTPTLEEVLTPTDRATGRTQDPQNGAHQDENAADRRQQTHTDQQADDQQNQTKNDHFKTLSSIRLRRWRVQPHNGLSSIWLVDPNQLRVPRPQCNSLVPGDTVFTHPIKNSFKRRLLNRARGQPNPRLGGRRRLIELIRPKAPRVTARLFDEALHASDEQPTSPGLRTLDITISGL